MPNNKPAGAAAIRTECITPILKVNSLVASIRYHVDVLGFKVDWGGEDSSKMASVSRDCCGIMLCQGSQGQAGTWIWIGVEDIEPLFTEFSAKDVKFEQGPTNYPWAFEMRIEDPDGHVLRFGSDTKTDRPVV